MIRCVRIRSVEGGGSVFEEGEIDLGGRHGADLVGEALPARSVSFRETPPHSGSVPHNAPVRQLVITLSGVLTVSTPDGRSTEMHPGEIILAEDTEGSGHSWQLIDDQPWRRAYVILDHDSEDIFRKT